jgi:capsular exopolysaccharide synthesis family protein
VIKPAQPGEVVSPVLILSLALGGVLGMIGGAGLAFVVDLADRSFRDADDIRTTLGEKVLGNIPCLTVGGEAAHADDYDTSVDPSVVAHHHPLCPESECFRSLRSEIYFALPSNRSNVLQVTSPASGDGKTTISANLATVLAQAGRRVALVDCDLRRPRVHELFDVDQTVGMAQVLAGEMDLDEALQTCAVHNLQILPAGDTSHDPADMIISRRFDEFLKDARARFDFVILDSPPLLAVADPREIAPRVDGVVLGIRICRNARPEALRAKQLLDMPGANLLGVVANNLDSNVLYDVPDYAYGRYGYGPRHDNPTERRKDGALAAS